MFVLYAFLVAAALTLFGMFFLNTYQLESYKIKNYFKKVIKFEFAISEKNKLNFTKRIKRLIFFDFFLNFWAFFIIFWFFNNYFSLVFVFAFLIFKHLEIILTFAFVEPIEDAIKKNYIKKAKKKLKDLPCKKIAITGSFGKTSTKNILYQILNEEFDVCATPKSFNTPMGICKTILEDLKETDDFFVVEFGARNKGDIQFLADLVGVDFAIITPIGNCHLETFGSLENIENTKYELCERTQDIVLFNAKSESTKKLYEKYEKRKFLVCEKNSFAYAKNIKTSKDGSTFDMVLDGKAYHCQTKLLGKANVDNIVVASAMAYLLGESAYSIIAGIKKVSPIAHRLELIKTQTVTIIDDSYNSNFDGFCQALDVLKSFSGRKIVVSPGVVELGKEQYSTNFRLAQKVCKIADVFVIMNKTNQDALLQGAENKNCQIYSALTRQEQKQILKTILKDGDVVLFENDLPDNYR